MLLDMTTTVEAGRKGGSARVPKGFATMENGEKQAAISKAGAKARWDAYYKEHPEKLKEKKRREKLRAAGKLKRGRPKREK
jgi:hypothetical protein